MALTARQQAIRDELLRLQDANGRITPTIVVNAARRRSNPLHGEFDWNDESAAERHREDVAGKLIRKYVTVPVVEYSRPYEAVFYVRDPSVPISQQGYIAITSAALQQEEAEAILKRELQHCEHAIDRARGIVAVLSRRFPGLSDELERMLMAITNIRREFDIAAE